MLAAPEVIWAAASDRRIDEHIRSFRGHRRVHCVRNPASYDRDIDDAAMAARACAGCPIVRACREQALRLEQGAGQCFGIRGGMTAQARQRLIARRPASAARTVLPATWDANQVLAYLATCGYKIKRSTLVGKWRRGNAPAPVVKGHHGQRKAEWDTRDIRAWSNTKPWVLID